MQVNYLLDTGDTMLLLGFAPNTFLLWKQARFAPMNFLFIYDLQS